MMQDKNAVEYVNREKILTSTKNAPAADVVEVVRCKNCLLHEEGCPLDVHPYMAADDGFCYLGKRKEA